PSVQSALAQFSRTATAGTADTESPELVCDAGLRRSVIIRPAGIATASLVPPRFALPGRMSAPEACSILANLSNLCATDLSTSGAVRGGGGPPPQAFSQ